MSVCIRAVYKTIRLEGMSPHETSSNVDDMHALLHELNSLNDAEWEKRSPEMGKKMEEIYKLSVPYFSKALQIRPDDTDMMRILFQIYTRLKNTAEANAMNEKLSAILGPKWQDN